MSNEVIELFELEANLEPDWYISLDKIIGFSRCNDDYTYVFIFGFDNPIRIYGNVKTILEVYDLKMKALHYD